MLTHNTAMTMNWHQLLNLVVIKMKQNQKSPYSDFKVLSLVVERMDVSPLFSPKFIPSVCKWKHLAKHRRCDGLQNQDPSVACLCFSCFHYVVDNLAKFGGVAEA